MLLMSCDVGSVVHGTVEVVLVVRRFGAECGTLLMSCGMLG